MKARPTQYSESNLIVLNFILALYWFDRFSGFCSSLSRNNLFYTYSHCCLDRAGITGQFAEKKNNGCADAKIRVAAEKEVQKQTGNAQTHHKQLPCVDRDNYEC